MGYIDEYRRRLRNNGNDLGEAYDNNTIAFMEATFHASPTFRVLDVISYEKPSVKKIDARVVEIERLGTLREVLFRPTSDGLNEGTYVRFDNFTWLIFDKYKGKVIVSQCNRKLKWYDRNGVSYSFDCVASSADLGSKAKQGRNEIEWNKYDVSLPLGQLFVFVELRPETEAIKLGQRFIFGNKAYEVTGIDDTTVVREKGVDAFGVLQMTVKITTIREEDDFINKVANNRYDTGNVEPEEEDGLLW